jgi:hypothetical protein
VCRVGSKGGFLRKAEKNTHWNLYFERFGFFMLGHLILGNEGAPCSAWYLGRWSPTRQRMLTFRLQSSVQEKTISRLRRRL